MKEPRPVPPQRRRLRLRLLAPCLAFSLAAAGCAPLQPYRTVFVPAPAPPPLCDPTPGDPSRSDRPGGDVPEDCKERVREDAAGYSLHFTEFDDQGWPYPAEPAGRYGVAGKQSELFFDHLRGLLGDKDAKLSVIVFVHGWKHNADGDDGNVRAFRQLLASLDELERQTACGRTVVGLYVGWRGSGLGLPDPLENLSFYSRKNAAQKVAQGNVRVVFSKLRALQDAANAGWIAQLKSSVAARRSALAAQGLRAGGPLPAGAAPPPEPVDTCERRMRLTIAGHSFGGLIVYTALSQALIKDVVELRQAEEVAAQDKRPRPPLEREGDLVVVINPAIEATRYDPLHRAATESPLPHYHPPLFVAVTSTDDQATRRFFPLGRALSTLWERYPEGAEAAERDANLHAFGQSYAYLSHDLVALPDGTPAGSSVCAGWQAAAPSDRLRIEREAAAGFEAALAAAGDDANAPGVFPRWFCSTGLLRLTPHGHDASSPPPDFNAPLWNIRTRSPVIESHGDITNPRLLDLLRQLYMDSDESALQRRLRPVR